MQVHRDIDHLPRFKNCVLTIGTFDGVHLGHRQILAQLKTEALRIDGETVIVTFHPHPRKVVETTKPPIRLINTIDEKIALLEACGVDHLVVVPFNEIFSQLSAEAYIEDFLIAKFHPHTIIIGYDHHFGNGRTGNYLLLEEYSRKLGFNLIEISPHIIQENAVSSTRIRNSLLEGHLEAANALLGYDYFFEGKVVEGNKIGRTLGYPTANLELEDQEKLIPANGIYIVEAQLADDVVRFKGMMSIGIRPTLSDGKFMIEVNLFDFQEEIYGRSLRVFVKKYVRPEVKFEGLDQLKEQLHRDKQQALEYFSHLEDL